MYKTARIYGCDETNTYINGWLAIAAESEKVNTTLKPRFIICEYDKNPMARGHKRGPR